MSENVTGVRIEIDPTHFEHATLAFLKSYWDLKRGARAMPARSDIRPSEIKEHLGWILLVDVLAEPDEFRFRMVGTRITEYFVLDPSGKTIAEAFAPYGEETVNTVLATHRKVVRERVPMRVHGGAGLFARPYLDFDAIYLPLSSDGQSVNIILSAFTFDRSALLKGEGPPSARR